MLQTSGNHSRSDSLSNRDELEADGGGVVRYLFPAPLRAVLDEIAEHRRMLSALLAGPLDVAAEDAAWRGRLELAQVEADVLERWRRRELVEEDAAAALRRTLG